MTIRVDFDQPSYGPDDPIRFQVVVEGEPATVTRDVTFTGEVTLPAQAPQQVSATTQIVEGTVYGPFTAPGYDVAQDPTDPTQYTATPNGG
ncbi:hypothetical protein M2302_000257 [Micromonospora sp. A200]|uniref:hypothetical protein n=1 Tax=Micromonospora sp. A200 TaxID=2940568 RepID=UPI00247437DC|nr:hypothetical protein [Micromonospora sp. A200]MDH6460106.1 hypothetical protein [Micromonospora sp. A200]